MVSILGAVESQFQEVPQGEPPLSHSPSSFNQPVYFKLFYILRFSMRFHLDKGFHRFLKLKTTDNPTCPFYTQCFEVTLLVNTGAKIGPLLCKLAGHSSCPYPSCYSWDSGGRKLIPPPALSSADTYMERKIVHIVIPGNSNLFLPLNKRLYGVHICKYLSCLGVGFFYCLGWVEGW